MEDQDDENDHKVIKAEVKMAVQYKDDNDMKLRLYVMSMVPKGCKTGCHTIFEMKQKWSEKSHYITPNCK